MAVLKQLEERRDEILKIADRHGAFNVRVLGSVARGEETQDSDSESCIESLLAMTALVY